MEKDRSWMYAGKTTEFVSGVMEFCNSALENQARTGEKGFYCPCEKCSNVSKVDTIGLLREHILIREFRPQYHVWVFHGEEGFYEGSSTANDIHEQQKENTSTWVSKEDVREFLSREMLNVSILHVFMSALNADLKGSKSTPKIGWLCPQEIRASHCLKNRAEVKEYLGRSIVECMRAGDKYIVAPYLEDLHWMFLVICPSNHTIYVFDSARLDQPRSLIITTLLNSEMRKLRAGIAKATIPSWKSIKCAQQPNGLDCGLYVMKFMFDLVASSMKAEDIEKVFNTPKEGPLTEEEINEVREKFASFLLNYLP